MSEFLEFGEDQ